MYWRVESCGLPIKANSLKEVVVVAMAPELLPSDHVALSEDL